MKNVDRRYFNKSELTKICIVETTPYGIHPMIQNVEIENN
jgi:hypothetical protein